MSKTKVVVGAVKAVGDAVAKYVFDSDVTKTIGSAVVGSIGKISEAGLQEKVNSLQAKVEEIKKENEKLKRHQLTGFIFFGIVAVVLAVLVFVVK